jgi:hypothetical protein
MYDVAILDLYLNMPTIYKLAENDELTNSGLNTTRFEV